eukprot:1517057-Ditylum_brightwellii.AAC.1
MKYGHSSFATMPAMHYLSGIPVPNGLRSASSPARSSHFLFNKGDEVLMLGREVLNDVVVH